MKPNPSKKTNFKDGILNFGHIPPTACIWVIFMGHTFVVWKINVGSGAKISWILVRKWPRTKKKIQKHPKISAGSASIILKTALIACHNAMNSTWGQASELPKKWDYKVEVWWGEMDLRLHDITEKKAGVREGPGYTIGWIFVCLYLFRGYAQLKCLL